MNKVRLLSIAVVGLLLLNFGVLAFLCTREGPHEGRGPRSEEPKFIIIRKLHLDKAQQDAYQALIDDHRRKITSCDQRSDALKNTLYALLKNPAPDPAFVNSTIEKIGLLQEEQERINFDHFRQIRLLCKPAQLADFDSLVNELTDIFRRQGPPPPKK